MYNSKGTIDEYAMEQLQYPFSGAGVGGATFPQWGPGPGSSIVALFDSGFVTTCLHSSAPVTSFVTTLTEHIKVKAQEGEEDEEGCQFVRFFPCFIWAVRDFTLELKINEHLVTEDDYLENALKLKKGKTRTCSSPCCCGALW